MKVHQRLRKLFFAGLIAAAYFGLVEWQARRKRDAQLRLWLREHMIEHPNQEALKEGIRQRLDEADCEDTVIFVFPADELVPITPTND